MSKVLGSLFSAGQKSPTQVRTGESLLTEPHLTRVERGAPEGCQAGWAVLAKVTLSYTCCPGHLVPGTLESAGLCRWPGTLATLHPPTQGRGIAVFVLHFPSLQGN